MKTESLPYVSLLAFMFGTTLVGSRFSVGQFDSPTYVALRMAIASGCYLAVYALSRGRRLPRDRRVWRHAPVLGVLATAVPMNLIVGALNFQSSGVTSLLLTVAPAITVLLAHFLLPDEKLQRRTAVGIALAISGAALLTLLGETGLPEGGESSPIGYLMVIAAMLAGGLGVIYARRNMQDLDTIDVASVRMWTAVLVSLPFSLLLVGFDLSRVDAAGYGVLFYAGIVGTFGAMLLEFGIIQRFGATATAMTANLIPIVALVAGALLLDEQITPGMLAAMALIVGGVTLITRRSPMPEVAAPSDSGPL